MITINISYQLKQKSNLSQLIQNYEYNDEKCCHKINIEFVEKIKLIIKNLI